MNETETNTTSGRSRLLNRLKAYISLNAEGLRLNLAEKLIMLLSMLLTGAIVLLLGGITMLFVTVAIAEVLHFWLPLWLSYTIMAGFNIILILLLFVLRKPLILNPLSRAITRIILS